MNIYNIDGQKVKVVKPYYVFTFEDENGFNCFGFVGTYFHIKDYYLLLKDGGAKFIVVTYTNIDFFCFCDLFDSFLKYQGWWVDSQGNLG